MARLLLSGIESPAEAQDLSVVVGEGAEVPCRLRQCLNDSIEAICRGVRDPVQEVGSEVGPVIRLFISEGN